MSNSFDPDQARHFVGPDLDPNCLQRLSADDTIRAATCNFQQCGILTSVDSYEPVQPPFKLRNSK